MIPIVVNVRDRLSPLKKLLASLDKVHEVTPIRVVLLDQASTYPPLLDWYESGFELESPYTIDLVRDENRGHEAMWKSPHTQEILKDWYVYTDGDMWLDPACPPDVLGRMVNLISRFQLGKLGTCLRIDDLPDHYWNKQGVLAWEQHFWINPRREGFFACATDTTFALYPPNGIHWPRKGGRLKPPYYAVHGPWYEDTKNLSEETRYYNEHRDLRFQPRTSSDAVTIATRYYENGVRDPISAVIAGCLTSWTDWYVSEATSTIDIFGDGLHKQNFPVVRARLVEAGFQHVVLHSHDFDKPAIGIPCGRAECLKVKLT